MPVYRGPGGAGDATNDATVTAVQAAATSAATSATNAANSATAAANSATGAATSATNASNSATTAAGQATTAAGHATNASTFATNASLSATDSADSATEAEGYASEAFDYKVEASVSAGAASDSADAAAASAALAEGAVDDALALYGDAAALDAAVTAAQLAETNAETAETNAETAATTATNAASTATTQATNAAASAVAADADATSASIDANEAQAAATAAQAAVSSATAIYGSIEDIQQAEANSEANRDAAAASATSASNSASTATTQAGIATTQATAAATSAAQASAVALGNEPVRHSVRPSLLLDFANTKTLDPRITFTRASTGTYYDGKTTVKAEENLVTLSQELDNAAWIKLNATVTANSTAAPDGTTTAETITDDTTSGQHSVRSTTGTGNIAIPASTQAVASIFLKAGTNNFACFALTDSGTGRYATVVVDLSTGTITQTDVLLNTLNSSSINAVGNGWYRVVLVATAGASGFNNVRVALAPAGTGNTFLSGAASYVGTGTTIFAWGAQVEQRSSVTAYTPTTTAPITNYIPALQTAAAGVARFEHNPVTGESLGLEIEEQRTNLLTYSDDFANAAWTATGASVTANTLVSPDGTLTADKLAPTSTSQSTARLRTAVITTSNGVVNTATVYVKRGEYAKFALREGWTTGAWVSFNLTTGAVINSAFTTASSITFVGNGWYRCSISFTAGSGSRIELTPLPDAYTNQNPVDYTFAGDGFSGVYIWGAQLEAGAFATSYIPTVASQVTRSADAASMTGTNFSSWYRTDEGTLYGEAITNAYDVTRYFISFDDGTVNNRLLLGRGGATQSSVFAGNYIGTSIFSMTVANIFTTASAKVAGVYKTNDFICASNSTLATADTLGNLPTTDRIIIGASSAGANWNGTIKKVAYYPKRLSNAELQSLTVI